MIRPGSFFWKLLLGHALLLAVVLGASVWLIVREVEHAYRENLTQRLIAQAVTLRHEVRNIFGESHREELQRTAAEIGAIAEADIRVTMIAADGTVLADSDAQPGAMQPHGTRPEFIQAMQEGRGYAERPSATVKRDMKYVAVRVDDADGRPLGAVRVAMPVPGITAQTASMNRLIWQTAAVGLSAAFVIAIGLAYVWSNPIRRITDAARSLSLGDLTARTRVSGRDEVAQLAASLNQMADSTEQQLQTIERQRKNLENLIRSLTEGVIVADAGGRVALMNEAACHLLGVCAVDTSAAVLAPTSAPTADRCVGRTISECIAHPELRAFLDPRIPARSDGGHQGEPSGVDSAGRPVVELRLRVERPAGDMHLLARCCEIELPNDAAENGSDAVGRLVVLTDITELTRTIRMKTDFVANASHELRTPLSAIRAAVETLEQMKDDEPHAANFIRVIGKHTARLEELVNDLLDLSRLESSAAEFRPETIRFDEFLDDMRLRFGHTVAAKKLHWESHCPDNCRELTVNRRLLQLVLDNLAANAIKFTEPAGHVWIQCARLGKSVSIEVRDDGCGIPKEDQDRVFERFYQVERARSGAGRQHPGERGTGLGLSIVRHAVAAMGASILLKSQPGKGTIVTIFLPQPT